MADNDTNILKFVALGRLAKGSSAGAILARQVEGTSEEEKKPQGKHQILAYAASRKDDRSKIYKQQFKEIMTQSAKRLAGGKRARFSKDVEEDSNESYEAYVLTEYIDEDPNLALVFFAVCSPDFGKHQSISSVLKDLKAGVYDSFSSDQLATAQASGPLHASLKPFFESIFQKYNKSQLIEVSRKVDAVKGVMKDNVSRALENVEQLEDMEAKAETMENQARVFEKRGKSVRWLMRCQYIKVTLVVGLVVLALLAYLIYYIVSATKSVSSAVSPPTGTGGNR